MVHKRYKILVLVFFAIISLLAYTKSFYLTYRGDLKEDFRTYNAGILPDVLSDYMRNNGERFVIYSVPNQVRNLLMYNNDFNSAYKSNKHAVIAFTHYVPSHKIPVYDAFYPRLKKIAANYSKFFSYIERTEINDVNYLLSDDTMAYKELKSHCGNFCVIDREMKSMLVPKKILNSNFELIEVILQQYSKKPFLNY